ncbi:MAG: TonB-dependent receptor [Daejeonella sp.]
MMKKFLLSTLVVLLTAFSIYAQVTTSTLTGTLRDSKETLIGASVKATHQPTGTVYGASTGTNGRFTISNMRVGGPYLIEITYIGYKTETFDNVTIKLGEPYVLNVVMTETDKQLDEVVVRSTNPNSILNANRKGATTNISRVQIQTLPSITRSVNDLTRLTPQANGTSVGGGNYRSNNFTVDGSNFNNQFGIGANIPANGSPISLDALEQISINVTPFDVRQTGFTGASVNAVTRSGTNQFGGTIFYSMRNEDQQGGKAGGFSITKQEFDQKQYGLSFGGPIIKNKLFFFVNAEFSKITQPGQTRLASTPANPYIPANTNVARPTTTFLDGVKSYLMSEYNYDPGTYQGYGNKSNNDKFLARLDWNIAKNHQFNIRYNQVESKNPSFLSASTGGTGYVYPNGMGRQNNNALHFSNSNYFQDANLYSTAAELNSSFGSKFTNTLRASYTHQNDPRSSESSIFPFVDILEGTSPITSFGYEPFTYGNLRDVKTYAFNDDFTMALGKHNITLGLQAEFSTTKNGFQPFGASHYTFASWNDFVNKVQPTNFVITYPLTADGSQAFPSFKFSQYSAYLQDEFAVSDRIKLTAGVRVEQPAYPDVTEIKTNPLVAGATFANGEKMDTGVLPQTQMMYSPRFGFNWDVKGDRSFQIRGGSGIFTGRIPFVWLVAQSGNAGMLQFTQAYNGQANTPGVFDPNPAKYIPATKAVPGTAIPSSIAAMSPDLKFPQTWKSSLAFDVKLPYGMVGTIEGIYNKDRNAVYARNANLVNPQNLNVAGYPDNRPIYPNTNFTRQAVSITSTGQITTTAASATRLDAIVMDNVKGGEYWSASAQLTKQFSKGLSLMLAYTRSEAKNYGDGAGDQILNLWSIPQTSGNSNTPSLSYTSNVIPNRVIAAINYRKEFLGNLASTVSFFYEGSRASSTNASRFSYTYSLDFNRDLQANDLIYVPKDPSEITFLPLTVGSGATAKTYTAQEQSDIFFAYIEQDEYLKTRKGQYAERNGAQFPWRNQVDFKFVQEVFKNAKTKNSFQFTWDVFNLGNLLNKDWGLYKFVNNTGILVPTNTANLVPGGAVKPTFRMATASGDIVRTTFSPNQTITSTYFMQFGFRYTFQ